MNLGPCQLGEQVSVRGGVPCEVARGREGGPVGVLAPKQVNGGLCETLAQTVPLSVVQ
ncbi:hypothetical protein STENM327S_07119 [Streptomyces tendae]